MLLVFLFEIIPTVSLSLESSDRFGILCGMKNLLLCCASVSCFSLRSSQTAVAIAGSPVPCSVLWDPDSLSFLPQCVTAPAPAVLLSPCPACLHTALIPHSSAFPAILTVSALSLDLFTHSSTSNSSCFEALHSCTRLVGVWSNFLMYSSCYLFFPDAFISPSQFHSWGPVIFCAVSQRFARSASSLAIFSFPCGGVPQVSVPTTETSWLAKHLISFFSFTFSTSSVKLV